MQFIVVCNDPGEMYDRGMERIVARLVGTQLMSDGLLDLRRHPPGMNQFRAHFRKIAPEVGLLDFRQRAAQVAGFDERRLSALGNGLIQHQVPDIPQQPLDIRAQSTLLRQ